MEEAETTEEKTTETATEDKGTVETQESTETQETTATEESKTEGEQEKEPGGSDGASVYQRKLFRENKQLKDKIQLQEVDKARVDERLKVTEEQKTETKKTERIFTAAEIDQAVEDDRISVKDGKRYYNEIILPRMLDERLDKRDQEREERDKRERPVNRAKAEISEYVHPLTCLSALSMRLFI